MAATDNWAKLGANGGDALGYTVGVDIGGTFTDCVAIAPDARLLQAKTLSTHASDPGEGVLDGIAMLASLEGLTVEQFLGQSLRVSHGATIGALDAEELLYLRDHRHQPRRRAQGRTHRPACDRRP